MQTLYDSALELAYGFLARADRTSAQVVSHLEKHSVSEDIAQQVLVVLTEQGYLDDRAYAQRFLVDKIERSGWSRQRAVQRLSELGIPVELAEGVLLQVEADLSSDLERAVELLKAKFGSSLSSEREHAKAIRFLLARGYEHDLALEASRHLNTPSSFD